MPDRDETQWRVGGRAGDLKAINLRVRNDTPASDLVLFYPGSGADILHPLFAAYARTKYFVFADILLNLAESLEGAIKTRVERLSRLEADRMAAVLKITSPPTAVWTFRFKNAERHVLLFRDGSENFLTASPSFTYDIFFDKDFWETSATHPLKLVLTRLRANGFFMTNGSIGAFVPFLADLGLRYVTTQTLNGPQYVYQKIAPTPADADKTEAAIEAGKRAAANWLFIDPGVAMDNEGWTDDDWVNALAGACAKARKAILTRMRLAEEHIWDATAVVVAEAFGPESSLHARKCVQAAERARLAWPNVIGEAAAEGPAVADEQAVVEPARTDYADAVRRGMRH